MKKFPLKMVAIGINSSLFGLGGGYQIKKLFLKEGFGEDRVDSNIQYVLMLHSLGAAIQYYLLGAFVAQTGLIIILISLCAVLAEKLVSKKVKNSEMMRMSLLWVFLFISLANGVFITVFGLQRIWSIKGGVELGTLC